MKSDIKIYDCQIADESITIINHNIWKDGSFNCPICGHEILSEEDYSDFCLDNICKHLELYFVVDEATVFKDSFKTLFDGIGLLKTNICRTITNDQFSYQYST